MIRKLTKLVVCIIVLGLLIFIFSRNTDSSDTKSIENNTLIVAKNNDFKLNEIIDFDGKQLIVTKVKRNYSYQYSAQRPGKELVFFLTI
jgi:hypothetical protein